MSSVHCEGGVCRRLGSAPISSNHVTDWRPAMWELFGSLAARYDPEDAINSPFVKFYKQMNEYIVCDICAQHWRRIRTEADPQIEEILKSQENNTRENMFKFMVWVHNLVNHDLRKPVFSLEAAKMKYAYNL